MSYNGNLTIWDLRSYQNVRSLQLNDAIVDVSFERAGISWSKWGLLFILFFRPSFPLRSMDFSTTSPPGSIIAVTTVKGGVFLYRTQGCVLVAQCTLPCLERRPKFSMVCFSMDFKKALLAGDNGLIYVFGLSLNRQAVDPNASGGNGIACETKRAGSDLSLCPLLGIVELPVWVDKCAALLIVAECEHSFHLAVWADDGTILIVEVSKNFR